MLNALLRVQGLPLNDHKRISLGLARGRAGALFGCELPAFSQLREFLLWRQQLRANVAVWEKNGRSDADLLAGAKLDSAKVFFR